jgi:hypothetical protein
VPADEQARFEPDGPDEGAQGQPQSTDTPAGPVGAGTALARLEQGRVRSRYAGVMLLHGYLDRVGVEAVFASLAGGRPGATTTWRC